MGRVLIVDDDDDFLELFETAFQNEENLEIKYFADVDKGLEELETVPYDVVITDLHMPKMDGVEFVRSIRSGKASKNASIFVVCGIINPMEENELKKLGVIELISKPFDFKKIIQTIHAHSPS